MKGSCSRLNVLLVDDCEEDTLMAQTVFGQLGFPHDLQTLCGARQALDYLRCQGKYAGRKPALPDLLLLDIHMPVMDGFSLLRELKSDPAFRKIPVIMLSSSSSREDIRRSFESGAASFLTKPSSMDGYKDLLANFSRYWLTVSALPE